MLSDILDSIKLTLHERVTSPLFGAFAIAWFVINYKFLVVLFSGLEPTQKFDILSTLGYHYSSLDFWLLMVIYPFVSSMVFLLIYPWPARWICGKWRQHQRMIQELRQKIDDETPLTQEEATALRKKHRQLEAQYEVEFAEKDRRIGVLQDEVLKTNEQLDENSNQIAEKDEELGKMRRQQTVTDELHQELKNDFAQLKESFHSYKSRWEATGEEIERAFESHVYRLFFRPEDGSKGSKDMVFGADGQILAGSNDHEASWRVEDGKLELLDSKGEVFSRFFFHPDTRCFISSGDSDLKAGPQYMLPNYALSIDKVIDPNASKRKEARRRSSIRPPMK